VFDYLPEGRSECEEFEHWISAWIQLSRISPSVLTEDRRKQSVAVGSPEDGQSPESK